MEKLIPIYIRLKVDNISQEKEKEEDQKRTNFDRVGHKKKYVQDILKA